MLSISTWLERIPKVELHLHLEGAIPLTCMWELMQKYGGDESVKSMDDLQNRFQYSDFAHFIQTWMWKNKFIRDYEDFTFIASCVAEDLRSQNIKYVESFISPPDFARYGLETGRIIEAIRLGLNQVKNIQINLVVDLVRDYGENAAIKTLEICNETKEYGVIGIGIGGSEKEFPPQIYTDVYKKARVYGFKTSAHAGEAAGAESIWGAIQALKTDRIGHATRSVEDPRLADYLVAQKIPLEMCPISNLRTKVISSIKNHPIRWFFDKGALVTINTDDPKMFNNTLVDEFTALIQEHQFTPDEIQKLTLNAVEASWLSSSSKDLLKQSILADPTWNTEIST